MRTLRRTVSVASELVRPWSADDVLTVAEAARRLRMRRADTEAWLDKLGLLVELIPSQRRVVWGAVVRVLDPAQPPEPKTGRRFTPTAPPVR